MTDMRKCVYVRCGKSGLNAPGNFTWIVAQFGDKGVYENMKEILLTAFDNGIRTLRSGK